MFTRRGQKQGKYSQNIHKIEPITATLVLTKGAEAGKIFILIDKGDPVVSCIGEFVLFPPHLAPRVEYSVLD